MAGPAWIVTLRYREDDDEYSYLPIMITHEREMAYKLFDDYLFGVRKEPTVTNIYVTRRWFVGDVIHRTLETTAAI